MREDIKALIRREKLCVLATAGEGKPYCSLMSYVASDACDEIYMISCRNTRKYNNLLANPSVSLLIDTRGEAARREKALTISGMFQSITEQVKKDSVRTRLAAAHSALTELVKHPDAEPFLIKIESCLLLEGVADAHFEKMV